jgi:hypothetical protein
MTGVSEDNFMEFRYFFSDDTIRSAVNKILHRCSEGFSVFVDFH